jgi:hypothetical protein
VVETNTEANKDIPSSSKYIETQKNFKISQTENKQALKAMPLKNSQIYKFITKILGECITNSKYCLVSGNLRYSRYFVLQNIIYPWFKLHTLPLITVTWVPISVTNLEQKVGVSIFVQQNLLYTPIDADEFCIDQEIEVCDIKLHNNSIN